jgi:hypothetical protein
MASFGYLALQALCARHGLRQGLARCRIWVTAIICSASLSRRVPARDSPMPCLVEPHGECPGGPLPRTGPSPRGRSSTALVSCDSSPSGPSSSAPCSCARASSSSRAARLAAANPRRAGHPCRARPQYQSSRGPFRVATTQNRATITYAAELTRPILGAPRPRTRLDTRPVRRLAHRRLDPATAHACSPRGPRPASIPGLMPRRCATASTSFGIADRSAARLRVPQEESAVVAPCETTGATGQTSKLCCPR